MQRRRFLIGSGAVGVSALAGCLSSASSPTENPDDSNTSPDPTRTVEVSGGGEVSAEPDIAEFAVSVEETGEDPTDVQETVASRIDELHTGLIEEGIDEEAITTGSFNIRERIDEERMIEDGVEPRDETDVEPYVYYVGSHSLDIETDDPENVGEYIDAAVSAGADEVGRISFTLADETREELREEAMGIAVENAKAEATLVVEEFGESLGAVKHVDTTSAGVSPVRFEADDIADDADTPTEIYEDDVTVAVSIGVEFLIE